MEKYKISFIGAGNMAEALIKGIIKTNIIASKKIIAADIDESKLKNLESKIKINVTISNKEAVDFGDIIVLAIKPQLLNEVLLPLKECFNPSKKIISILAGIKIKKIEEILGKDLHIIRAMPNIAVVVLEGAAGICFNDTCDKEDEKIAFSIFNSVGLCEEVEETLMDVVTGLSGSGPAYIFTIIEALIQAGVKMGLSYETALTLSAQTTLGAAAMVLETQLEPKILRDKVTSPQGTTFAGLKILEDRKSQEIIIDAVTAATNRAKELSEIVGV